jgi:hypothetical protein
MALSANTPRTLELGDINEYELVASCAVYQGSAIGMNASGYVGTIVNSRSMFVGFAENHVAAQATEGAARVRVRQDGEFQLTVTGVSHGSPGASVYATDDGTFTMTADSVAYAIGMVKRYVSTGLAVVKAVTLVN